MSDLNAYFNHDVSHWRNAAQIILDNVSPSRRRPRDEEKSPPKELKKTCF
jgi:hypothetical protein